MMIPTRLIAPWRTAWVVDPAAFDDLDALSARLSAALTGEELAQTEVLPWRSGPYASLDDDYLPAFLSPLVTVVLPLAREPEHDGPVLWPTQARLHVFFDRLAVVEVQVEIDADAASAWSAADLERHLHAAVGARLTKPVGTYLATASDVLSRNALLAPAPDGEPAGNSPLWVNRTYALAGPSAPAVAGLTRADYIRGSGEEAFAGVWVHPGTNIVAGDQVPDDLLRPLLVLQHAAALCAELQAEQVRVERAIRAAGERRSLAPLLDRVRRLGDLSLMIEIELAANATGFQANRRCVAEALHRAYGIDAALAALKGRQAFVERSLDAQFKRGQVRRSRVAAQLLALLTAAQLMSVLADLYGTAGNLGTAPPEGHPGVLSLVRGIGFNDIFSLLVLATLVVVILRYRRGDAS